MNNYYVEFSFRGVTGLNIEAENEFDAGVKLKEFISENAGILEQIELVTILDMSIISAVYNPEDIY
jgi:hypothetical protein